MTSRESRVRYFTFLASDEAGFAVLDTACNRAMLGELGLPKWRAWFQKQGLRILIEEIRENFTFGNSSSTPVTKQVILPIGIEGRSGELRACLTPGAPLEVGPPQ